MPPESPRSVARDLRSRAPYGVHLLEVDPDLGAGLSPQEFEQALEQVVLPALSLAAGPVRIEQLHEQPGVGRHLYGVLVLSGTIAIEVTIASRTCTRLIGPTELLLFDDTESELVPLRWGWSVLEPAGVAVMDERLLTIARRWPALLIAIFQHGAPQTRNALLQQAISQLPRVEDRLLALMWTLAERQGVVRHDGVWLRLPITHDTLAQMIGARRPTVSLGLKNLSEQGLLKPEGNGWLLDSGSLSVLGRADA